MTAVKKELINKIVVDLKTDLVNHLYFMLLEISEFDPRSNKLGRKRWVINIYNNWVRKGYIWNGKISRNRRALENVNYRPVI